jgi:hypothetical protein
MAIIQAPSAYAASNKYSLYRCVRHASAQAHRVCYANFISSCYVYAIFAIKYMPQIRATDQCMLRIPYLEIHVVHELLKCL